MDTIYGLIPLMLILGLIMLLIFFWTVKTGQYDDLEGDANRILMDEDDENTSPKKDEKVKDPRTWPDDD